MRAGAIAAVLVCLVPPSAFAQRPEVVETELVELRNTAVANMNDHEVIVGSTYNGTISVPFRWTARRGIDLFLGEVEGAATAINDRGTIVGWLKTPDGFFDGFIWSRRAGLQRLGLFIPAAINNKGMVVGACAPSGDFGQALGCVWEDGAFTSLGTSGAFDVNDRGEVTGGVSIPPSNSSAFIWSRENGMTLLPKGDDPDTISTGLAINDRGEVAGFVVNGIRPLTPARWSSDGDLVLTPIGDGPLVLINNKSLAVGRYLIPLGPSQFGWFSFGLTAAGRVIPLGEGVPLALTNRNVVLALLEGSGESRVFLWRVRHVKRR